MKFMGSKRTMLLNGLGDTLAAEVPRHKRFADLFTGSGAVAWHVAQRYDVSVLAGDLQHFSVALADGVLLRTEPTDLRFVRAWLERAKRLAVSFPVFEAASALQQSLNTFGLAELADDARALSRDSKLPITSAYGGYYYSPLQSLKLDALRQTLPRSGTVRALALASLIWTASRCAASPGHTAQPFKPNSSAGRFLMEAWQRDIDGQLCTSVETIGDLFARRCGTARRADASEIAAELGDGDLAFLDPPYSGVHYSRFYHVLETVTRYELVPVSGTGRYPPQEMRPTSDYSIQTRSTGALTDLLGKLSAAGSAAIITFPAGHASNGLSGDAVCDLASAYFKIETMKVSGRFSTLGGNTRHRAARLPSDELILTLSPRA